MCHRWGRKQEPKSLCNTKSGGGISSLTASTSASGHSEADVASISRCRLMVSVSVCSCSSHFLSQPHKQTQQQQQHQHHQHLHLARSASCSSRTAGQQQVIGFRAYLTGIWCGLHALLVLTLGGRLYSQRLFTGNRRPTASMLLYWLPQQPKWPAVPSS